jgi:hypothetical protein
MKLLAMNTPSLLGNLAREVANGAANTDPPLLAVASLLMRWPGYLR